MRFTLLLFILLSSNLAQSQLRSVVKIDKDLSEASAIEMTDSNLYWTIEDAGNDNTLFALNSKGNITRKIIIENSENDDWEDLTSDAQGNIYIGDFGNNSEERELFIIYKVKASNLNNKTAYSEKISFTLPEDVDSKDFEAFFLFKDEFYVFSKEKNDAIMIKVSNKIGKHQATLVAEFELKGKNTEITSVDISPDGSMVALLNHDKIWILKGFKNSAFFNGSIERIDLEHDSQKEGIFFKTNNTLLISDERDKDEDGFIYEFKLK